MGCSRIVKNILRNVAIDQSFSVLVINCYVLLRIVTR